MKKIKVFWNMTPCVLAYKSSVLLIDVTLIPRTAYSCTEGKVER